MKQVPVNNNRMQARQTSEDLYDLVKGYPTCEDDENTPAEVMLARYSLMNFSACLRCLQPYDGKEPDRHKTHCNKEPEEALARHAMLSGVTRPLVWFGFTRTPDLKNNLNRFYINFSNGIVTEMMSEKEKKRLGLVQFLKK